MRKMLLGSVALLTLSAPVAAQVYVSPYVKKDGTYVQGHYRSSPNSSTLDNYSTRGNVNPYTGAVGTRSPYGSSSYGSSGSSFGSSSTNFGTGSSTSCVSSYLNPC
jgi:hypothetical protein